MNDVCLILPTQSHTDTNLPTVIVKASSGPRYVVSYRPTLPAHKLKPTTRVSLDMTTLTIMRILPREVDPMVYNMSLEDPGSATFAGIGGLGEQVRELREVIELPLMNPELFEVCTSLPFFRLTKEAMAELI